MTVCHNSRMNILSQLREMNDYQTERLINSNDFKMFTTKNIDQKVFDEFLNYINYTFARTILWYKFLLARLWLTMAKPWGNCRWQTFETALYQNINIEIKRFTIIIGGQGTGKSTISKLLTIFRDAFWMYILSTKKHQNMQQVLLTLKLYSSEPMLSIPCRRLLVASMQIV